MPGFAADVQAALAARGRWLEARDLARVSPNGDISPRPNMTRTLQQLETERIVRDLSRQLNAAYIPSEPGGRISGIYELAITTPTGKVAVVRREDTFTLAPWKPQLEPFRGRAVMGMIGLHRVTGSSIEGGAYRDGREATPCVEACRSNGLISGDAHVGERSHFNPGLSS